MGSRGNPLLAVALARMGHSVEILLGVMHRPESIDPQWRALATLPSHWSVPQFPLKAADFMARGVEKGPRLGAAMRAAEEAWIEAGFPLDRETLARIADEVVASDQ